MFSTKLFLINRTLFNRSNLIRTYCISSSTTTNRDSGSTTHFGFENVTPEEKSQKGLFIDFKRSFLIPDSFKKFFIINKTK